MHFSMWLWPYGRWGGFDGIGRAAQRIEELGFESITVSDHTVCPTGPEGDGLMPDWPDWAVTSAYLATITTKLRIVACVAVPYRSPLVTAKQPLDPGCLRGLVGARVRHAQRLVRPPRRRHG